MIYKFIYYENDQYSYLLRINRPTLCNVSLKTSYRNIKRTVFYKFRKCNKGYLTSYGVKLRYYIFPSLYHAKWQTVKFLIICKMNCPSDTDSCKITFKQSSHVWFHFLCTYVQNSIVLKRKLILSEMTFSYWS